MLNAKLRALGTKSKKHRIAVFELPPHKRTVIVAVSMAGSLSYYIQLPYLVFFIPYRKVKSKYALTRSHSHASNVRVRSRNSPMPTKNINGCRLGVVFDSGNICFGGTYNLYAPEKSLQLLFSKIANLFFETVFLSGYLNPHFRDFQQWEINTKSKNFPIDWEQGSITPAGLFQSVRWKSFK